MFLNRYGLVAIMLASALVAVFVAALVALADPWLVAANEGTPLSVMQVVTATPTQTMTVGAANVNQCDPSSDPSNVPDVYEPQDNSSVGATPLVVGSSQTHNLCSTTSGRDIDWYVFDAVTTQTYTIRTSNPGVTVDTYMTVEGPNGFLEEDDDSGPGLGSQIIFTPATNGRHFIQIWQASKTPFDAEDRDLSRAYTILVSAAMAATPTATDTPTPPTPTPTGTPSPCRDPFEFDDRPEAANGLYPRQGQAHILCGDGDVDWVWVDLVADKPYRILTSDLAEGVDTLLLLYDGDGETLLASNDDYPGKGLASEIRFTSPTTRRYFVKAQDTVGHGADNFAYTLTLDTDGLPLAGPCLDTYEPDGLPSDAREILLRERQSHTFCPEGDADWVRFFGQAGKSYTLASGDLTVGTDTIITVFGPSEDGIIASDDDSGGNLASRVDFVAPVSAIYHAQIKNVGDIGGKGQAYSLSLTSGGGAVDSSSPTPFPRATAGAGPTTVSTASVSQTVIDQALVIQATPAIITTGAEFADPSFAATWRRADAPVRAGRAQRSWLWGARAGPAQREPYKGSPGGERLTQYFDKARMEITDPSGDRSNPWFVTNGLLVREMISGLLQRGDATSDFRGPAAIPLVGDGDVRAPTYASLTTIASLDNDRRVPNRVGMPVTEALTRAGKVAALPEAPYPVVHVVYIEETGHNIPDVFWRTLNERGLVETEEGDHVGQVTDWRYAFGLPLTEAYWTRAVVGGVERDVLAQAFERRVLTYTPGNPTGFEVEMGNVGQHYHRWRYD